MFPQGRLPMGEKITGTLDTTQSLSNTGCN